MSKLPFSIFQYSSHLEFLQDAYDYAHSQDESFSYDKIATLCDLKSRTEARNFFKGIKKPTDQTLTKIAGLFGLDEDETRYLSCLHRFYEAGGSAAAYALFEKLISFQKQKLPATNPFREIEIATSVLHMTLLSILELEQVDQDPVALAHFLKNRYTVAEIHSALIDIEKHGYARRNAATGGLVPSQKHIKKYDYNTNFFLKRYHDQCLEAARSSLENETPSERYLVGASFCINSKIFPRIVQKMNAFVENLMQLEGVAGSPDTVIQINQQLIKMTSGHANEESGLGRKTTERALDQTQNPVIA